MSIQNLNDTIAAIATPWGQGGVGLVRISGKEALLIADSLFVGAHPAKPSSFRTHSVHYGRIVDREGSKENIVDEVLLTVMKAPKSYTCEDVVEISCHGGLVVVRKVLGLVLEKGARLAEPGEFTKRAFLNGRLDLTQAEAVLDIIQARTESFLKVSVQQLKGDLALELEAIRESLVRIYTELEAIVNFPEDDIDAASYAVLKEHVVVAKERIVRLLASRDQGRALKEGVRIVICGKPNVGKSSLLNALLRQPRAIVSPVEGTTRDTIEELAQINELPVQLIDTAGILEPRDAIEKEAVRRSHLHIEQADLVLFVVDGSEAFDDKDRNIAKGLTGKNVIVVLNKSDRGVRVGKKELGGPVSQKDIIAISALHRQNIDELKQKIVENVLRDRHVEPCGLVVSNARQLESLGQCLKAIERAEQYFMDRLSFEFISEEIKIATRYLDQVTGRNVSQDLLDKIFSSFCIGK